MGRGTGNRIVPLGGDYIELLAVVDEDEASAHPFGRWLSSQVAEGDRLVAWCLSSTDIDSVGRRLDLPSDAWGRTTPDGTELKWRLVGNAEAFAEPPLPFFIGWDVPAELHPARGAAAHRVPASGIAWVEVSGDADRFRQWTGDASLPVRFCSGEAGIRAVGIATDTGEIVLRSDGDHRVRIHRLFADEAGESHFEDVEVDLPHQTIGGRLSDRVPVTGLIFREVPGDYDLDWHPAPRRQYIVNLDASVEITASDGESRRIGAGEVLLVEDTWGKGHLSKSVNAKVRHALFITLE